MGVSSRLLGCYNARTDPIAAYVGDDGLEALIREDAAEAGRQGFGADRGVVLVVLLMLTLGHGGCDDPLFPWIARTLTDQTIADSGTRARRLETMALNSLDQVLLHLEQVG